KLLRDFFTFIPQNIPYILIQKTIYQTYNSRYNCSLFKKSITFSIIFNSISLFFLIFLIVHSQTIRHLISSSNKVFLTLLSLLTFLINFFFQNSILLFGKYANLHP